MNNYTERTWMLVSVGEAVKELMKTYVQYPLRKQQSEGYSGPNTLTHQERFQHVRDMLAKRGRVATSHYPRKTSLQLVTIQLSR